MGRKTGGKRVSRSVRITPGSGKGLDPVLGPLVADGLSQKEFRELVLLGAALCRAGYAVAPDGRGGMHLLAPALSMELAG